jgi:predicted ATPase
VREVNLFQRDGREITTTAYFKEGGRAKQAVRDNSSLLSVCAQNNGEVSTKITHYFHAIRVTTGLRSISYLTKKELQKSENREKALDFLRFADIQIKNLKHEEVPMNEQDMEFVSFIKQSVPCFSPKKQRISFAHTVYDNENPIGEKYLPEEEESNGTRKLFSYSIPVLLALENGTPLFIDEFDNMLHPNIIEAIVKLFNSQEINRKNAQLVISCHSTNLLSNKLFRRDQIWFCEKDTFGATSLYSLVKYNEPVRNDAAYGKNYLHGKYGAVPHINNTLF